MKVKEKKKYINIKIYKKYLIELWLMSDELNIGVVDLVLFLLNMN